MKANTNPFRRPPVRVTRNLFTESFDNDIATCGACGEVEHTPEQLADCIDSALGPRRDPEA